LIEQSIKGIFFGACEKRPSVSLFWKGIQSFTHVNSFHPLPKCLTSDHFWQARLGGNTFFRVVQSISQGN